MAVPFDNYTAARARERIAEAQAGGAPQNRLFYDGDHWQGAEGWIGPRPEAGDMASQAVLLKIQRAFVSKNVVKEVTNRHTGGVIGREPSWKLTVRRPLGTVQQVQDDGTTKAVDEAPNDAEQALIDEAEAALTEWWDARGALGVLQGAAINLLLATRGPLRLYVPSGLRDGGGRVPRADLAQSLGRIYLHAPDPAQATVYTDPDTQAKAGLYAYRDAETSQERTEIVALDENDATVVRLFAPDETASEPIDLGGHITMYEMARPMLVTPQVRQQQKLLNLALTMLGRNVEIGGFIARILFNAQLPGEFRTVDGVERFYPDPIQWGAGVTNNFMGAPITDQQGRTTGYATPSYARDEPVEPTTFLSTKDAIYRSALEETQQLHALIAGDATASGESRKQARADFEQSLSDTETQLNRAGRWLLETALAMAAAFAGQPGRFAELRAVFECRIDTGPLSAEELRLNKDLSGGQPLLSQETAMARSGVDDVDAELAKIAEESEARASRAAKLVAAMPPAPGQQGDGKQPLVQEE